MIKQILASGGLSIGIGVIVCSAAQGPPARPAQPAQTAQATAAARKWTPPKTPWGEPDLQGMWPLNHLISTPLQRQEKFGDRRLMTEDEFQAAQKNAESRNK